tara:strand:+ start:1016 stop:1300 length:285 start_codon:yes stop_codon:yes gene_type:complete
VEYIVKNTIIVIKNKYIVIIIMLDQETLRPVIISMALYLAISQIIPEILKKPTNIGPVDEIVAMLIAQKGSLTSGAILTGLIIFMTNYINDEFL